MAFATPPRCVTMPEDAEFSYFMDPDVGCILLLVDWLTAPALLARLYPSRYISFHEANAFPMDANAIIATIAKPI